MFDLLLATGNTNKLAELSPLFTPVFRLHSLSEVGLADTHEETGDTFEQNSRSKALYYSSQTNLPVLADDSGLIIDALGGLPGVRSARYPNPDMPYSERCRLILQQMDDLRNPEERTARFCCVASVAVNGKLLVQKTGIVEGFISMALKGSKGFGYDPIFFHEPTNRTFAQLPMDQKNRISHRYLAFRQVFTFLHKHYKI